MSHLTLSPESLHTTPAPTPSACTESVERPTPSARTESVERPTPSARTESVEHPTMPYINIPLLNVQDAPAPHLERENAPPVVPVDNQDEPAVPSEEPEAHLPPPLRPPTATTAQKRAASKFTPPAAALSSNQPIEQPKATRGRSKAAKPHVEPTHHSSRDRHPLDEWWKLQKYKPHAEGSAEPGADAPAEQPEAEATLPPSNDKASPNNDDEKESFPPMNDDELNEFATAEVSAQRVHAGQALPDPQTLKEALRRSDSAEWQAAADAEIQAHITNGTWVPCKLPPSRTAIGCRWVMLQKYKVDGSIDRYKVRLVAKG
ncbi:hypothetical protein NM688_g7845 [Phlebia brevispora]|uniref:Uncharacterized protein n=1 Tax=Phlebia brevispora TaxID=194682 RepID=A0ACC1S0G9_9APHY|nr:hypothetical protein NM688_g7845 [Phlebia brevispora]